MTETIEQQSSIVRRILAGTHSEEDAAQADANYQVWLREAWDGNELRALAACIEALEAACGREWKELTERQKSAHVWLFSLLCFHPHRFRREARHYRRAVLENGGFHEFAKLIRGVRGEPE
ncbi:hypothetical protein ACFVXG_28320 [Kitasatospora sp. NPDC058162]|uniref:hypothetical protein n=1 Tax=Kitasatospora sp. NPDC058162 TaxID=3346362 RepID=UPI0036DA6FDA